MAEIMSVPMCSQMSLGALKVSSDRSIASTMGAAVVVSEEALDLLTAGELQAVIARELGHEYFVFLSVSVLKLPGRTSTTEARRGFYPQPKELLWKPQPKSAGGVEEGSQAQVRSAQRLVGPGICSRALKER